MKSELKRREPVEVTPNRCQTRSARGKGGRATSPGKAQQQAADNRRCPGFDLAHGRGLFLVKGAGATAPRTTHAEPPSASPDKFYRCACSGCRGNKFHSSALTDWLLDVTLQHDQKLLQMLSAFRWRVGVFNAVLHVGMNQGFRKRLDGLPRGHQLHENLRAVAVFFQHPLNRVHLADDPPHPKFLGIALAAGMTVLFHASQG